MMIVVTGAAGFIGANLVKELNRRGETSILAVDHLKKPGKFRNLSGCTIADYMDKQEFFDLIEADAFDQDISAVLHQGACSDTMEHDGRYMMMNNYRYTHRLFHYCQDHEIPMVYASSASVYGAGQKFEERPENELPLNVYGYSKLAFDQHFRYWETQMGLNAPCVGLRYFNVYGPMETHKERMASVIFHFYNQYRDTGRIRLFEGTDGYANGEQRRDFISVDDVVKINLWCLEHPEVSGVFNAGTGKSRTFNEVAIATLNALRKKEGRNTLTLEQLCSENLIEYIPFPDALRGKYQNYTEAHMSGLRAVGYDQVFFDIDEGVDRYVSWLADQSAT